MPSLSDLPQAIWQGSGRAHTSPACTTLLSEKAAVPHHFLGGNACRLHLACSCFMQALPSPPRLPRLRFTPVLPSRSLPSGALSLGSSLPVSSQASFKASSYLTLPSQACCWSCTHPPWNKSDQVVAGREGTDLQRAYPLVAPQPAERAGAVLSLPSAVFSL